MSSPQEKQGYHHGDLRRSLIDQGLLLIDEIGIEVLSLRQLAERVGVSTPALYHHFRNKQALLAALGEASVAELQAVLQAAVSLDDYVLAYVRYARDNPARYALMFGRSTWASAEADEFRRAARHSFRLAGERLAHLQRVGVIPADVSTLRLAQVGWATLHGLCSMYNDGLAFTAETVEDIARHATHLLQAALRR